MLPSTEASARVLVAALLLVACGGEPPRAPVAAGPPSLLVVSLDTTRADRLGVYGAERDTTPRLDVLAEEAFVFTRARTPVGNTLVAHASLFSGLAPRAHGARPAPEPVRLPAAARTLAEDLAAAGWQTAAFTTHSTWLTPAFGMDQGFEHFDVSRDPAPEVLARAREWLDARDPERPFFLFVHLFDVHSDTNDGRPYRAPDDAHGLFTGKDPGAARDWDAERVKGTLFLEAVNVGRFSLRPGERDELLAQYDEGLRGVDAALGPFVADLRAELPRALWTVVLSDHGEEFQEHGGMLHYGFYEEVLRVPLLVAPPPALAGAWDVPRTLDAPVTLMDLRPTLLALAGLDAGDTAHGRDLLPWMRGGEPPPPEPLTIARGDHGLVLGDLKLVRRPEGEWELYDLAADPGEQHDLAQQPGMDARIEQLVRTMTKLTRRHTELERLLHAADEGSVSLSEEDLRFLDEMGYLDR